MKSSTKQGTENSRLITLHQRLYHALNLGLKSHDGKGKKWICTDLEIQRLVVRSIDAFLDCISTETSQQPLIKDSVADLIMALEGILQLKNEAVLILASKVAVKMISVVPSSTQQSHVMDLIHPLSSLLSFHHLQVAMTCASALKLILSSLSIRREKLAWDILNETNAVVTIVSNIQDFHIGSKPSEFFQEMASLLSKILWRWSSSRFRVWNDAKLMQILEDINLKPDYPYKVEALQLYSALALCGSGALKLLENGAMLVQHMVHCMASTQSHSVRVEGFKLAQCFARNKEGFLKMLRLCCKPIVEAIISVMSSGRSHCGKVTNDQLSLLTEACRLALFARWAGEHHKYYWELGIDKVLVHLLLNNFYKTQQSQHVLSLQEQIVIAQEGLNANFVCLRPFIWDIVGWLAAHCKEDFDPKIYGREPYIRILMTCVCLAFVDSIHSTRQMYQNDVAVTLRSEPACRSVLMMMYSPSKYIASQVRLVLTEILRPRGKDYLKHSLDTLKRASSPLKFGFPNNNQILIHLISLACYSGLPQYQKHILKNQGIKTLLDFTRWCLSSDIRIKRSKVAPHLRDNYGERTCCWDNAEDWEGDNMLLLFGLWGLAELIHHSDGLISDSNIFASQTDYNEAQLLSELTEICTSTLSPGPRWYAAYILSYFGWYGFPSKLGKKTGKAVNEKGSADIEFILTDGESLTVHGVILTVRCPSLLPPEEPLQSEKISENHDTARIKRLRKEVRLSAHVDYQSLLKILEYVYLGYLQAGVDLVKKLKTFARRCNLHHLLQMLSRKHPNWGTPYPSFDLWPAGPHFSDIILEARSADVLHWTCSVCSLQKPHVHAHKVLLWSNCDYLQALFQSGMQDSHSQTIKVPVSWEALVKLVKWFYSAKLPNPVSGCLWDNLDLKEKLREVQPYLELCWLAEFWLLRDIHEDCSRVIISCLDSARDLSIKIIEVAANLNQWNLAEVAANHLAPSYNHLRYSGEFEALDEELREMVRAASVRLSQGNDQHSI